MTSLEINTSLCEQGMLISCKGRLDANHTGQLQDLLDQLLREGHYTILMDFSDLEYLSSAGIRLLISQYKTLQQVNGSFHLKAVSEPVEQILKLVGMSEMLKAKAPAANKTETEKSPGDSLSKFNYKFSLDSLDSKAGMKAVIFGQPELLRDSGFRAENTLSIEAKDKQYALGLGAIGDSYENCKNRFGEFIMVDGNIAYLPGDGSKKPDYMMNSGDFRASLTALYGLRFEGDFSALLRFESENKNASLGLSELIESIEEITGHKAFLILSIAEISGLVGVSLNQSPVDNKSIFGFPQVRESLNFTTEPAYNRMLSVNLGVCSRNPDLKLQQFTRPLCPGSDWYSHFHTAVFPYVPLKKSGIDVHESIRSLFDQGALHSILHLACDSREIAGLGESQFIHGFCWLAPVESFQFNS